jgi:acetyl esterase/lipase
LARTLRRTIRVRIGPFVRHVASALHGGPWNKSLRRVPSSRPVTIHRADGFRLAGAVYHPAERPAGPVPEGAARHATRAPGILLLHGWDPQGQRHGLYVALADALARRGFLVLTMNLRGYPGTGDVLAALDFLAGLPDVDEDRVMLLGHSYGAGLVIPAMLRRPSLSRAIIYGPSAWVEETITGDEPTHREFYHERFWRYMDGVDPVPLDDFLRFSDQVYIPVQAKELAAGHAPILVLDGGAENEKALSFSEHVLALIPAPVDYWSIPGTDHFCNCAVFGNLLVEDRQAIDALVDRLETWFDESPARNASAGTIAGGG